MSARTAAVGMAIGLLCVMAAPAMAQQQPTTAQQRHIQNLLAEPGARWAVTRRMNPVIDNAIVCRDLATVDLLISAIGNAKTDRIAGALAGGKTELTRQAAAEPDPAAFGCVTILPGTRVLVESADGPPVISTGAIRGVTHPAMIKFEGLR
jgi:hypothetical protein